MNRLFMISMAIMGVLAVVATITPGVGLVSLNDDAGLGGDIDNDGVPEEYNIGWEISAQFDEPTALITFLMIVAGLAIVAGVTVLGSGVKESTVQLIFKIAFFGSLWTLLALQNYGFFHASGIENVGSMVEMGLTLMFIIGFAADMYGGG